MFNGIFIIDNMFWLLVILSAVFSAPLTGDPFDMTTKDGRKIDEQLDVINDSDIEMIIQILTENIEEFRDNMNENDKEDSNIFTKELLTLFEDYETFKRTKLVDNMLEPFYEREDESIPLYDDDMPNEQKDKLLALLYDYIDENLEKLLKELVEAAESSVKPSKNSPRKDTEHSTTGTGSNKSGGGTIKEEKTRSHNDDPKEAPLVDVNLDVKPYTSSGYDNLKVMYDKRGGLCTLINGYSKTPIYVISVCPLGTMHSSVRDMCEYSPPFNVRLHTENIIDLTRTPVQDHEGFVYKNIYCAQCNDVESMQAWETKLDCEDLQQLSISDGTNKVTLMDEFDDQIMGCDRRLSPAMPKMIHQCTHIDAVARMNQWYHHQPRIGDGSRGDSSPFPLSFSILMNFGFDGKTHILFTTSSTPTSSISCNQNEKYDPYNNKCRPIVCYSGYQLVQGTCQKIVNYDVDTNADDLSSLPDVEDPLNVTLIINNVTVGDLYTLAYSESTMVIILASLFNISSERIQNLTISLVNCTNQGNRTYHNMIEIHPYITPTPSPKEHVQSKIAAGSGTHTHSKGVADARQNISEPADKRTPVTKREPSGTLPSKHKGESPDVIDGMVESLDVVIGNRSLTSKQNKVDVDSHDDSNSLKSKSPADDDDDESNKTTTAATTTQPTSDMWNSALGFSARINFILQPAHKNKTLLEKSVKTVVQSMSDLINSNEFMLTINGTNFKVQGVHNAPQPASMSLFCPKGLHPYISELGFELQNVRDPRTGVNVTAVTVSGNGRMYYPGEYDLTFNIDGNTGDLNKTHVSSFAFVCDMPKISDKQCDRIVLIESEFAIFNNKSIKFADHVYNMSEYEYAHVDNNTVIICTPDWIITQLATNSTLACGEDLVKLVIAESYLTFILGVTSLVCMLSVLITYGIFEKLRNLPGINTMNLTLSLFLGELLFIVSGWVQPNQKWLCSAFGLVLHYMFLASFFWMNVMSYDVFKTFAKKCILRRIRKKQKYVPRYALYAWGGPFVIVLLCAIIDFGNVIDGVRIGYGGQSALGEENSRNNFGNNGSQIIKDNHAYSIGCWIQQPVASMVAFGGPMILILFGNTIMFIRTIICIRDSTRSTKSSVRKTSLNHMAGRDDVMLYVRMSTVMGFTWIFGLASAVVSAFAGPASRTTCIILHLLGILFILFNCSQGIFIFFAFVFNRRVLALYRGLIGRLRKRRRERPSSICSSRRTLATNLSQTSLPHIT